MNLEIIGAGAIFRRFGDLSEFKEWTLDIPINSGDRVDLDVDKYYRVKEKLFRKEGATPRVVFYVE